MQWCSESKLTKHYEKIKRKRGEKIAIVVAVRKLFQAIYYMLRNKEPFRIEGEYCGPWVNTCGGDRDYMSKAQS